MIDKKGMTPEQAKKIIDMTLDAIKEIAYRSIDLKLIAPTPTLQILLATQVLDDMARAAQKENNLDKVLDDMDEDQIKQFIHKIN